MTIIRFEHGITVSTDAMGVAEIIEHTDERSTKWVTTYTVTVHTYVGDFTYKTCDTHDEAVAAKSMLDTQWGLPAEGPSDDELVAFMEESGAATEAITEATCGKCGSGLSDVDGLGWKHTEPFGSDKRGMCVSAKPTFPDTKPGWSESRRKLLVQPPTGPSCADGSCSH